MIRENVAVSVVLLFAVSLMVSCSNERYPTRDSPIDHAVWNKALLKQYGMSVRDGLRIKTDTERNRLWVLGLDNVRVYDTAEKRLIREIALPNWSTARFVCPPDMALDPSGSALVSSNVQPRLARIDAGSFELTEYEIRLREKEQWDTGFGAIVFTADGALYALTSSANSLWKVDVAKASASMIELYHPPLRSCALTTQFLNRLERSRKP